MTCRSQVGLLVVVGLMLLAACGGEDSKTTAQPTPSETPYVGYPNSIVVLGHSGATGQNSDPQQPGVPVRENSWATGANPAVKSVYLRILAENPGIEGHNVNLAENGASVARLVDQAQQAVALKPKPDLVVIQIMDNDLVCPATAPDYDAFRSTFVSALAVLAKGAPASSIFVVSQFGSPTTQWRTYTPGERASLGGTGECDFLDPAGRLVPDKLAELEEAIHGYEGQLAAGCQQFARCRYDEGAFGAIIDKREYISNDLNHFSIAGHAQAAATAWDAMKRAGLLAP
ncbi:SGNH/GDSL hydrolase family protein [Kribbella sp. C-35]|uniref:SGNH/GDSL hydrolase family protein n=1 Tax=Kribbella sp. C-35 TaxID=2789276 RepID=UPI00397E03E0